MATLQSPGVQVNVIDESFYNPTAPGTTPIIFVATAQDKTNPSGGIAQGTTAANNGKVWIITSQRDLVDTFGSPEFYVDNQGNSIHGSELNEYGLQAAYSLLGVSSRAYIARADVNLGQLTANTEIPKGSPKSGSYWTDSNDSLYGVFEWDKTAKNGSGAFVAKTPKIIDDTNVATAADTDLVPVPGGLKEQAGDYAMVVTSDNENKLWYRTTSTWVAVANGIGGEGVASVNVSTGTTAPISTLTVTVSFTAPDIAGGVTATGTPVKTGNTVTSVTITNAGSGYTSAPTVTFTGTNMTVQGVGTAVLTTTTTATTKILAIAPHTSYPDFGPTGKNAPTGSVWIKTTTPGKGANWTVKYYSGSTQTWNTVSAPIYSSTQQALQKLDSTGGKTIPVGTLFIETDYNKEDRATFKIWRRTATGATVASTSAGSVSTSTTATTFIIRETLAGSQYWNGTGTVITIPGWTTATTTSIAQRIPAAVSGKLTNVVASYNETTKKVTFTHLTGGDIELRDGIGSPLEEINFNTNSPNVYGAPTGFLGGNFDFQVSNWKPLQNTANAPYGAQPNALYTLPANGTLWYDARLHDVDIMAHDGTKWVGYLTAYPATDPAGPIIGALEPVDGDRSDKGNLVTGDIWISTANADQYGKTIYVYNGVTSSWELQDTTDNDSPDGWVFANARWSDNGVDGPAYVAPITDLLSSNYVDPDAPDPALYPRGIRLWNLRRSGFVIKKYVQGAIDKTANNHRFNDESMEGYNADRWSCVSGTNEDGSGVFGRLAQRKFVVRGLKSFIDTNTAIRDTDTLIFNLIATPGYPETIVNMVSFNTEIGQTAFVVGDAPFRLQPNATDLTAWGMNTANAYDNGDTGLVTHDEYLGVFYPSGYTTDNKGKNIVVPASHMMLRTIINSDAKSYQWFAPAGTRRGGVDNATSVGYIDGEGEFKTTALHQALRDVLQNAANNIAINPIATLPGVGLVNYGQKTRAKNASALDRINVVRLVAYLRRQLSTLAKPFLFEPNDTQTRRELKSATENLLIELVGQRALYDFIVVCDTSNNTPARIDRSELYMDIAVEPVKAVEFIYIPLRIKNTGDIAAGR
jgi:hypothetical protein